jgi:serine/threonine-protein kinase
VFEAHVVRVWLFAGVVALAAAFLFTFTISSSIGLSCAAVLVPYFGWNLYLRQRLKRGPLSPGLRATSDTVEASLPWGFFVAFLITQGPGYTLASWVPPMLFCLTVMHLVMRFRVRAVVISGVAGGVLYLVLYFAVGKPALPESLASMPIYQPSMQYSRAVSLIVAGVVAAFAARGLRAAIARAEVVVRERELFGKYRLAREIAKGGMATVFEAFYCPEGGFERRVAVKHVHPHLAEQTRFVDLFRSEAEISSRLAHPNIVQVMDFGRVDQRYYLAMEYVDGITMAALLTRMKHADETMPPAVVATIGAEILAGLAHAHEGARGSDGRPICVVHRDLCPQNVLLSKHGEVKITDFGVARALRDVAVSHTNTLVGHMAYVAPETIDEGAIDPRVDLFALGVMLWELLMGRRLFGRTNEAATLQAVLQTEVPSVSAARDDVCSGWDALLARALQRRPEDRFATARGMLEALRALERIDSAAGAEQLARLVRRYGDGARQDDLHERPTEIRAVG